MVKQGACGENGVKPQKMFRAEKTPTFLFPLLCFSFNLNNGKQPDASLISATPSAVTETWTTWILLKQWTAGILGPSIPQKVTHTRRYSTAKDLGIKLHLCVTVPVEMTRLLLLNSHGSKTALTMSYFPHAVSAGPSPRCFSSALQRDGFTVCSCLISHMDTDLSYFIYMHRCGPCSASCSIM